MRKFRVLGDNELTAQDISSNVLYFGSMFHVWKELHLLSTKVRGKKIKFHLFCWTSNTFYWLFLIPFSFFLVIHFTYNCNGVWEWPWDIGGTHSLGNSLIIGSSISRRKSMGNILEISLIFQRFKGWGG